MKLGKENAINRLYFVRFGCGYAAYIQAPNSNESVMFSYCARFRYYWKAHMRANPQMYQEFPSLNSWARYCARYVRYNRL